MCAHAHPQITKKRWLRRLAGRHLLTHPFYRRWEAGTLAEGELAAYAEQYRLIERELPVTLAASRAAPRGQGPRPGGGQPGRRTGQPAPHTELFESFAQAAGAGPRTLTPPRRRRRLLAAVRTRPRPTRWPALAMVAAYEVQAADIAASKADGCAVTTAWIGRHPVLGRAHDPGSGRTPAGRSRPWPSLGADPAVVQAAARSRPTPGGFPQRARRARRPPAAAC